MRRQRDTRTTVRYWEFLGWAVKRRDERTTLPLGNGIVADVMPEGRARPVASEPARAGACGPILVERAGSKSWVFLADFNDVVASQDMLPEGVSVLGCPGALGHPRR